MNQRLISVGYFDMMEGLLQKLTSALRVSLLWKVRDTRFDFGSLPDDIVAEILIRLPSEQILRCRTVCKRWYTLTSTKRFTEEHFKMTNSHDLAIIIMYARINHLSIEQSMFLLDDWGVKMKRKPKDKLKKVVLNSSNTNLTGIIRFHKDGVLTFTPNIPDEPRDVYPFVLYNPLTHQELVLQQNHLGYVCACFYHSSADEYKVIYYRCMDDKSVVEYQILCLGSPAKKLSWKRLPDYDLAPCCRFETILTSYSNSEVLHWVSENKDDTTTHCGHFFLMFDVNKEEFSSMPHPGDLCVGNCYRHKRMFPFGIKSGVQSLLCICDCSIEDHIDMWVLEDLEERIWVKRHSIHLDLSPIYRSQPDILVFIILRPFGVINGELLINMSKYGIFAYNFSTGTLRKIIDIVNGCFGFQGNDANGFVIDVRLIQKSLVSFPNFNDVQIVMEP